MGLYITAWDAPHVPPHRRGQAALALLPWTTLNHPGHPHPWRQVQRFEALEELALSPVLRELRKLLLLVTE